MVLAAGWKRLLWVAGVLLLVIVVYAAVELSGELRDEQSRQLGSETQQTLWRGELFFLREGIAEQRGLYLPPRVLLFPNRDRNRWTGSEWLYVANTLDRNVTISWEFIPDGAAPERTRIHTIDENETLAPGEVGITQFLMNGPLPSEPFSVTVRVFADGEPYRNATMQVVGMSAR